MIQTISLFFKKQFIKFKIHSEVESLHQRAEMLQTVWMTRGRNDSTAAWLVDQQHETLGKIRKLERELANVR